MVRDDIVLWQYFGILYVRHSKPGASEAVVAGSAHDEDGVHSEVRIENFLLQKETSFSIPGRVDSVACTHNFIFFLVSSTSEVFCLRLDSKSIACVNLADTSDEPRQFRAVRIDVTVETKPLGDASSIVRELSHLEKLEECLTASFQTSHPYTSPEALTTAGSTVRPFLICATDSACYAVHNSDDGPSLLRIFSESDEEDSMLTKILQVGTTNGILSICAGKHHVLLLNTTGVVYTFGTGSRGELGHGSLESEQLPRPVDCLTATRVVAIAAGSWHSLALTEDGDVYVWGWNCFGQLGDCDCDDETIVNLPLPMEIEDTVNAVSAYRNASFLKKTDGSVTVYGKVSFALQS